MFIDAILAAVAAAAADVTLAAESFAFHGIFHSFAPFGSPLIGNHYYEIRLEQYYNSCEMLHVYVTVCVRAFVCYFCR